MYNDNKKNPYYACVRCKDLDYNGQCAITRDSAKLLKCEREEYFTEGYAVAETDLGWHEGKPENMKKGNKIVCLIGDSPKYRVLTYVYCDLWEDEDGIEFPGARVKYWMPIQKINI